MKFEEPDCDTLPVGCILTMVGTGSEMNAGAVITNTETKQKIGHVFADEKIMPKFAVLDPGYTMTLPHYQMVSGIYDIFNHICEQYFSGEDDNTSDYISEGLMRSVINASRIANKDPQDYEARSNLMWPSAMAENGILKVGRRTDFECHQIEHQLGAYTDCNHGQGLAVLHPVYYRHIVENAPEKFARMGKTVFSAEGAAAAVDALAAFIRECGLPTQLSQLRSKVEITPELLRQVADSTNLLPNGYKQLTHDEVYEILMECL